MFEAPVTFIESKKQKTSFEDVDGNKVIGYLEKDSQGTSNNNNFPGFQYIFIQRCHQISLDWQNHDFKYKISEHVKRVSETAK